MKIRFITALIGAVVISASLNAAPAKSEKHAAAAVQFRQAMLQLVRSNVGALGGMAKDQIPMNAATLEKNAMRIEQLSLMMDDYFSVDTRNFPVETDALPGVWEDYADFQSKIVALTTAANELKVAAQQGDESSYKAKIGAIFKSCKGCHDTYKAE
ncbi:MAG: cytochrome c [Aliiglaciecola sp.]|uniref:c-type cytochrome n=1 Tax=Aliiglaciecola sp. M165 TaxID=2593649 RepID=UPI00117DFB49|nr:cytochrome c [Aliiglaciecola sp. M165]TRY28797.1 cytochrome c [Aliiglaciecola sp. M165]